jgi:methylmalonyl-CoA mutase
MAAVLTQSPRAIAAAAAWPLRIVTATSVFDGHDVAINLVRRLLKDRGAEVVHLGHNRPVAEIVRAVLQEDADAVAVSSYQGGHLEFFRYLLEELRAHDAGHVRVFGGGGATITATEVAELEAAGMVKVYTPEDGRVLGLEGMADDLLRRTLERASERPPPAGADSEAAVGRWLTAIERGETRREAWPRATRTAAPVIGITGPGGAGKSTLLDELLRRLLAAFPELTVAVLAMDPTPARGRGGALLADRLRINCLDSRRVFMRSQATRRAHLATSAAAPDSVAFLRQAGFGLVVVETAGTGQGDTELVELADVRLYVMTSDYGAPTQLEKIAMLDHADFVVLNKRDKPGALDAVHALSREWQRRRHRAPAVYPTMANHYSDPGLDRLFAALCARLAALPGQAGGWSPPVAETHAAAETPIVPPGRTRYLAEIAAAGRAERAAIEDRARAAARAQAHHESLRALGDPQLPAPLKRYTHDTLPAPNETMARLRRAYNEALDEIGDEHLAQLGAWPVLRARCDVGGRESLSRLRIPAVAAPDYQSWGELTRFLGKENVPGEYPYTAGVHARRRDAEEPTRMFAGEGTPERTNRRFHYLARGQPAVRLSTAFDPVTLYGENPSARPDLYGRIGMSGVSVATLDDLKKLYSGFDLATPHTSVSMTINGPAPVALAWFLNAAIDQAVEKHLRASARLSQVERLIAALRRERPRYDGALPDGHDGLGLMLLGVSGAELLDPDTYARIAANVIGRVRGTVQADILKEDQAQNECLFPLEFALRLMGDMQAWLIAQGARHYYGVSMSGYHIAEAGANPVTQLAFTLANAFTLLEYYLARGLKADEVAPRFSFFFSNGLDPEYAVIGRVARRVWARALKHVYRAGPTAQRLKYHVQTSGRSLQARDIAFNDVRTTLEALYAYADHCNSLHTNAYDEAVTTPTEESVRRALAIQFIVSRELGLSLNENPLQGSFLIEHLTDAVEEAVYREFDRINERGGVLGAMEGLYQRAEIQEESREFERRKQDGSLPVVGVNTFLAERAADAVRTPLTRASDAERHAQIEAVALFRRIHAEAAPAALARLKATARSGGNVFAELMETVRCCSLGEITHALYEVAGRYRRNL